jgi:threonine synthase
MAWKMGAPIHCFRAPTTINDTVPRYFASGRVDPKPSVQTLANAMDVGAPSNLERLQWLFDGDVAAMKAVITTEPHTDDEVRKAIAMTVREYGLRGRPAYGDSATSVSRRNAPDCRYFSPPRIRRNSGKLCNP